MSPVILSSPSSASRALRYSTIFQLNRLGLAQHYYNKTSLLDLTSDIEVAKFFATCKYNWNNDTYEAYHSDEKLGVIYIYDMRLPSEFRSSTLPQLSSIGKQYVFLRSAMQSGFLLNMPPHTNLHDLPNVYRIYFRHDKSPDFPQLLLDDYYANAPTLWKKFCSDIFFLGSEGFFMKKALEGLIYN